MESDGRWRRWWKAVEGGENWVNRIQSNQDVCSVPFSTKVKYRSKSIV